MKIIVFKDLKNNCILSVSSMEYYHGKKVKKTETEIEKAITEVNMAKALVETLAKCIRA